MAKIRKKNKKRLSKAQRKRRMNRNFKIGMVILALATIILGVIKLVNPGIFSFQYFELSSEKIDASKPEIDVQLLTVNPYSRPGIETGKINGIVIHYTANPGASAKANRDYFENLKDTHVTKVSSNFVVGLEGEIIQCVPTWEVAYASNDRNRDTVSIECCHPDENGEFTKATYRSLVQLTAWLCMKFDLEADDVMRHYDVTGKICPKYYVENETEWDDFRRDVANALANTE